MSDENELFKAMQEAASAQGVRFGPEHAKLLSDFIDGLGQFAPGEPRTMSMPPALMPMMQRIGEIGQKDLIMSKLVEMIDEAKPEQVGDHEGPAAKLLKACIKIHHDRFTELISQTLGDCDYVERLQTRLSEQQAYGFAALVGVLHGFIRHGGQEAELVMSMVKYSQH
jgi:hypothetical protein